MKDPVWRPRAEFEALRPCGVRGAAFEGLWVDGDLAGLARPCIAIVGTRSASGYGRTTARAFARDLCAAGCTVLSGLALGIDAAAHEGALEVHGVTIGVLGGGHRQFFPRRNERLAQRMIEIGGAVLSPFAPDRPALPHQFLQRNGIVAALADALVVIEAPARSGALNTASWAAGRIAVFAVPGDIDRPHVAGCHALIRDGVTLARSANDVLDELRTPLLALNVPSSESQNDGRAARAPSDPLQAKLLDLLQSGETSLDELCAGSGDAPAKLLSALAMLEMSGAIESRAGARYALRS